MTRFTRLEFHARSKDLEPGLQACVADPLWLLARQWQFGEFRAEDAASPVAVHLVGTTTRPSVLLDSNGAARRLPPGPLEAMIEAEPASSGPAALALSAEAGLQLLRMLDRAGLPWKLRQVLREEHGFADVDLSALDRPRRQRMRLLLKGSFSGRALADALKRPPVAPPALRVTGVDVAALEAVLERWLSWYDVRFADHRPDTWRSDRMEYDFAVAADTGTEVVALQAPDYSDGRLDWADFRLRTLTQVEAETVRSAGASKARRVRRALLPRPVRYRGMPSSRFWELEDHRVYLGDLDAGPTDMATLLLVEFALLGGDDWFQVPVDLPVGRLCRIDRVVVRNTFGERLSIAPASAVDADSGGFSLFALSGDPAVSGSGSSPWLYIAPRLAAGQQGRPLEDVALMRDEMANLAWAVERSVEGPDGRPIDRFEHWVATREPAATVSGSDLVYRAASTVPPHWFPLVPVQLADGRSIRLRRGSMLRGADLPREQPQGRLLEPGRALRLFEEEVPRAGVQVQRAWQLARWHDGSSWLWVGRRKQVGRPERASNLRHDMLVEPEE